MLQVHGRSPLGCEWTEEPYAYPSNQSARSGTRDHSLWIPFFSNCIQHCPEWTIATLQACLETPGVVFVVHAAFSSPEATRVALCSKLLVPSAALNIARDFHFSTLDIVKRAAFNVAVHYDRYYRSCRNIIGYKNCVCRVSINQKNQPPLLVCGTFKASYI